MAFNFSPKIVTDGLVLYLDAANTKSYPGSGNTWRDLSKVGNNGTLTNGPTFNSTNGGNIVFDGTNYIDSIGTISDFSFIQNTAVFTITFWMKTSNYTALYYPAGNTPTSAEKGFFVGKSAAGALTLQVFDGSGVTNRLIVYSTVDGVIADNNWHHISYSANKLTTTVNVYVDGVLKTTGSSTGLWTLSTGDSTRTLNIGRINNYNPNKLVGNIANFSIYNKALTAQEILQNYNATKTRFGL